MRLIDVDVLEIMFKRIGLYRVTKHIVDNVPTVDAEPVVHCKDCSFHDKYGYCTTPMGEIGYRKVYDDDFCSCGFRKDETIEKIDEDLHRLDLEAQNDS